MKLSNLKQLPNQHQFKRRSDASGDDDVSARHMHKVVQSGKEGSVLVHVFHIRIRGLLEREVDSQTVGSRFMLKIADRLTFISRLHETWTAAGDNVTTHGREFRREPPDIGVNRMIRRQSC